MQKSSLHSRLLIIALAALNCFALLSCKDDIDTSDRYVFDKETVASYLSKHQDYSEYVKIIQGTKISKHTESTIYQLLSARGNYTCFAPSNEAIANYLDTLVVRGVISEPSWDAFTDPQKKDSIYQVIAYNSIIDTGDGDVNGSSIVYETSSFPSNPNEELSSPTLADRKLSVRFADNPDSIFVNNTALIDLKNHDIPVLNGMIHQVHGVIAPGNDGLAEVLKNFIDANRGGFIVTAKLVEACGLYDTLSKVKDEVYEELYETGKLNNLDKHPTEGSIGYLPKHRKYGFTLFAETDEFWSTELGKDAKEISVEDVKDYIVAKNIYPNAKNDNKYTSTENVLNQFVTYHLLPERLPVDKLVVHYNEKGYDPKVGNPTVVMTEFYTTMGKRRLLKILESRESKGVYLNRFPNIDNGRHGTYREKSCDTDKEGIYIDRENCNTEAVNGIIYPINKLLVFDETTQTNLGRQRIRFDVSSLFPEFMNNDIRGQSVTTKEHMTVGIPSDNIYQYFQDMEILEGTKFYYLLGRDKGWPNYLGDEFNVIGRYEMIIRLPPVPRKSTYELRIANSCGVNYRSMCQVYWGTNKDALPAMGTPLDFRVNGLYRMTDAGNFPSPAGWEEDKKDDDDYNAEVDKKMRNNGFMKGLELYCAGLPGTAQTGRGCYYEIRRIMLTAEMDPEKTYYIKFKNVMDKDNKQLFLDYIEYCPKEVYNNPMEPEDIW